MTNKRSHLYHIKTNSPQRLHYRYWGLFFQCFRGAICQKMDPIYNFVQVRIDYLLFCFELF